MSIWGMGLTDALITRLGTVHRIIVRPVGAVRKYASGEIHGRRKAAGGAIGAGGQHPARAAAGQDTGHGAPAARADGEVLWATKFDEKFTDMFAVEDSISQKVADRLTVN